MQIDIITAFPDMFRDFCGESILRRAQENGLVQIEVWDLRTFAVDKHKTVDDYPYGGGPGMILKPEPIFKAVDKIKKVHPKRKSKIVFMTPQGEQYSQQKARELSKEDHLIFICGHYRGVDERIITKLVTDEISIGDYILTGGELPTAVVVDSVVRLLPGALGDFDSAEGDSFSKDRLDHPHYTRPAIFRKLKVPEILLSGHHARIHAWREEKAQKRTADRRPDLLNKK
ncbi:tRNA (guanosine(37)-N1)-methyltransferase TrmD [bacterium]|nr:tRNA (guanosine(37)-N1)-methyltransferase TrmD [bacterium]